MQTCIGPQLKASVFSHLNVLAQAAAAADGDDNDGNRDNYDFTLPKSFLTILLSKPIRKGFLEK